MKNTQQARANSTEGWPQVWRDTVVFTQVLTFTIWLQTNTKIKLLRRENEEWFRGSLRNGAQGLFPASYVQVKVPLPDDKHASSPPTSTAIVLYDFEPAQPGDLKLTYGDTVTITHKLNEEWYFGECNGLKGQFPANYVQVN